MHGLHHERRRLTDDWTVAERRRRFYHPVYRTSYHHPNLCFMLNDYHDSASNASTAGVSTIRPIAFNCIVSSNWCTYILVETGWMHRGVFLVPAERAIARGGEGIWRLYNHRNSRRGELRTLYK